MSNEFITTDSNLIYQEIITSLESSVDEPLYPGDERRIFGEALVPLFVALYNAMNDAARQKMLRYARGSVLDALGERVDVERLSPTEATTTLRFSMLEPVYENVIIPEGTRVTSDSTRYFETISNAVIVSGNTSVDVKAASVGGGKDFNDIPIGAINTIVDPIIYVDNVTNLTATSGGDDEENDDSLRERIRLAPSHLSTAGPVNAYKYWAMSADSSIADASVKSEQETLTRKLPVIDGKIFKGGEHLMLETLIVYKADGTQATPGADYTAGFEDDLLTITIEASGALNGVETVTIDIDTTNDGIVKIIPICEGGEIPSDTILAKVLAACNASEVRPLTDLVKVEAPKVESYDIELTYYTTPAEESACINTIEGAGGAIDQYNNWQSSELGRHINPDKLRALILAPSEEGAVGATRVVITSPVFTEINDVTIAKFSGNKIIRHEVTR